MAQTQAQFTTSLKKYYSFYTGGFIGFVVLLGILEAMGVPNRILGYLFLFATIALYAGIGIMSRTADVAEYYVAGRRVPAFFNGMATGADWMSAASFIGMAGTLYATGYAGLAFIMGWTGGYVLVALFLAPYLRKFGQFTIPDFLAARYGGNFPRFIGVFAAILCSFTYVVAQVMGVGIITSRFTGLEFGIGVFVGLAGILVCSFLGGMRAVTWTQVAQYIILIIAYMIPVVWLSVKHTGVPIPQLAYGYTLQKVTEREGQLRDLNHPDGAAEQSVRNAWAKKQAEAEAKVTELTANNAAAEEIEAQKKAAATAKAKATASIASHAEAFPGKDDKAKATARLNFLALIFCLMVGTAALPHILMRFYTTPSVKEARISVFWSLFFIFLLYFTAPALAVLVKYEIYTNLVGSSFASLPKWVQLWNAVDKALLSVTDVNGDGIVQLAEIALHGDIVVLATPEIAGLPYVISGLVAAGGLAAALSTADGLLLTIANALSHDVYYKMIDPHASTTRRLAVSKALLLVVALLAAYVASQKPADILFLVSAAFSFAAAAFFPALSLGIFWKRANKAGAITGMVAGLGTTFYYMATTQPWLYKMIHGSAITPEILAANTWFGIAPISAGVFGIPLGFVTIIVVSMLTPAPNKEVQEFVEHCRYPRIAGDVDTRAS